MSDDVILVSGAVESNKFRNSFAIGKGVPRTMLMYEGNTILDMYMATGIEKDNPLNENDFFRKRLDIIKFNSFGYLEYAIDILLDDVQFISLPQEIKDSETILFIKENETFKPITANDLCQKIAAINTLDYNYNFKYYIYYKDENQFFEKTIDRIIYYTFKYDSSNNCVEIQTVNNANGNRKIQKLQPDNTWSK